jgi:hypothetical protein
VGFTARGGSSPLERMEKPRIAGLFCALRVRPRDLGEPRLPLLASANNFANIAGGVWRDRRDKPGRSITSAEIVLRGPRRFTTTGHRPLVRRTLVVNSVASPR